MNVKVRMAITTFCPVSDRSADAYASGRPTLWPVAVDSEGEIVAADESACCLYVRFGNHVVLVDDDMVIPVSYGSTMTH